MKSIEKLIKLRHDLHQHAELSHQEKKTQAVLKEFLKPYAPKIIPLTDGKAFLAEFDSGQPGPNIVFRADLDALPIKETIELTYSSKNKNISHKCGHDGHMTLVASLAQAWQEQNKKIGKLGLLFQHAEEQGEGAIEIVKDEAFKQWQADMIFGFHNIPGIAEQTVVCIKDTFACTSKGIKFIYSGKTSHAGEPHLSRSPMPALLDLYNKALDSVSDAFDDNFFLATPVFFNLGHENYGISPGNGCAAFTLRSKHSNILKKKESQLIEHAKYLAKMHKLTLDIESKEYFPATTINSKLIPLIDAAATATQLKVHNKDFPYLWSEDFGHYTQALSGIYFGLGVGCEVSELHSPFYNFNDDVIEPYSKFLKQLWVVAMNQYKR
ncbi:amidohydrolase [bacterium]|nr:amidohydrolase [bacterium]